MQVRAVATAFMVLVLGSTSAQEIVRAPRIFDVELGMHVDDLPAKEFVEPSCGNRGGPRGRSLYAFQKFLTCKPEIGGLREIWFAYDDTREYIELARRDPLRRRTTAILDQPVILSLLVDLDGHVQGYRISTDGRAPETLRLRAHEVARHFRARFNLEDGCVDVPTTNGEMPIDSDIINQRCEVVSRGRRIVAEERLFYRVGQNKTDPNTGHPMANAFESSATLEVQLIEPMHRPAVRKIARKISQRVDAASRFQRGELRDCAGCDLTEADLRYRNLEGADLSGAKLNGALLHASNLGGANLEGADLSGANLNRANLAAARLAGAKISNAMLYQSDLQRTDLQGATLTGSRMGRANLTGVQANGADFTGVDLGEARITSANFTGARLTGALLADVAGQRANFTDAELTGIGATGARLGSANFLGARLDLAQLNSADLTDANLTNADLSGANLLSADLTRTALKNAVLNGARMPDNTRHPSNRQ